MNLTVLIGTSDGYSVLWDNFVTTFDKHWKIDCRKLFIGETKEANYEGYEFYHGDKKQWGERVLGSLELVDTDYVFFVLEDYWFHHYIRPNDWFQWRDDMHHYKADRLQVSPSGHQRYVDLGTRVWKFDDNSDYKISMQPSFWRTEFLKEVLKKEYSPWDFEVIGSSKLKGQDNNIFIDKTMPSLYFNAVRKGLKKSPGVDEFIKSNELKPLEI